MKKKKKNNNNNNNNNNKISHIQLGPLRETRWRFEPARVNSNKAST